MFFLCKNMRNSIGRMADAITECWIVFCVSYCIDIVTSPVLFISQPFAKEFTKKQFIPSWGYHLHVVFIEHYSPHNAKTKLKPF